MTKEEFQKKVNRFYAQNKPLKLLDVVAKSNKHRECQVCGNRNLKKLCQVRNEEQDQEWFIGWNCYSAIMALQEQEERERANEIVKCSDCGKEQRRGSMSASCPGLCVECCLKKYGLPIPEKVSWFPEPIKEVK